MYIEVCKMYWVPKVYSFVILPNFYNAPEQSIIQILMQHRYYCDLRIA